MVLKNQVNSQQRTTDLPGKHFRVYPEGQDLVLLYYPSLNYLAYLIFLSLYKLTKLLSP